MKAKKKQEKLRGLRKLLGVGVVRSLQLGKSTLQIWRREHLLTIGGWRIAEAICCGM
jgi:hypothetical protein